MAQVPLGEIEKHFWLTRSVSRCMGISLTEVMADGRLTPEGYAELVTRCRASSCDGQCALWLADQQALVEKAPDFCANAETLNGLKT
ncbi:MULTISPECIES: DUF6455 family protein [unclassified Ruegeria]|uniref:DUF6455 family protein n=1 Tax=unclassified Ruegeria TaxID=2625375 RepID=UPI0014891469|nr:MULTISPECIES: DUF6455 family protein [unclassified Ruegeria]NOD62242.1 hypothetical protein [Ruegeria sp. HKCCD6109]NOD75764.1 hypothetical protein [Ruegeria sp. HKCCD4332]NOD88925.1 hypothetical protein [Ruegeria sp. HKCCD4318]NOD93339.1 hypothetical protein [Ruegeria sp. HKCCD4884]NOE14489.1 hypothetical protein [Ruegeria sp. HKCCD4318-2]